MPAENDPRLDYLEKRGFDPQDLPGCAKQFVQWVAQNHATKIESTVPLFWLLQHKGKPFNLKNHFMFESAFRTCRPKRSLWKTARQVGKSLNTCAAKLLTTICLDYYNILFICPRFEQVKRLSNNNMRALIDESQYKETIVGREQNVLQRDYLNGSKQFFSFAFMDADRVRGIAADEMCIDEVQDINWDFIPEIAECLSASPAAIHNFMGTPNNFQNTIEKLWRDSTMSEWIIKCGCGKDNVPSIDEDLLKMIGKETCICAKCGKPLDCAVGQWVARHPDRMSGFSGRHISQVIHPLHYRNPEKWRELHWKMRHYTVAQFNNDCLGESWDSATRLISEPDLIKVSQKTRPNTLKEALRVKNEYSRTALGVDWGGGGDNSQSFTTIAIVGQRPGMDAVECIYCEKLNRNLNPGQEVKVVLDYFKMFNPTFLTHDYNGDGATREVLLVQSGLPQQRIIPFGYAFSPNKSIITFIKAKVGYRSCYEIDKPRSIVVLCTMMKAKKVLLPEWESSKDVSCDFLNLIEKRQAHPRGSDIMLVDKIAGESDDFVHALNYASSGIWYSQQQYPNIAEAMNLKLNKEDLEKIDPRNPNWYS
jgi:hypothetical protein